MSFEKVEGSSSEINENQEIDEVDEAEGEVSEDEDSPEYSIEENMDKLDSDEDTEIDEANESGDNASEGDEGGEYSLEDNMDKLDEEEAVDDDSDAPTLPGLEDDASILPGLEDEEAEPVDEGPEDPNDSSDTTVDQTNSVAEAKSETKSDREKFLDSLKYDVNDRLTESKPNTDSGDDTGGPQRQRTLYPSELGDER